MIIHRTKDKQEKTVFIEYLTEIPYSHTYITKFLDCDIDEHIELRWFDVIDGKIVNFDIKTQLDGSIKPVINAILLSLKNKLS